MLLGLGVQSAVTCCRLYDVHSIKGSSIVSKSDCLISSVKVSTPYQHSSIHPMQRGCQQDLTENHLSCLEDHHFEGSIVRFRGPSSFHQDSILSFFDPEGFLLMECYSRFYPTCHGWSTYTPNVPPSEIRPYDQGVLTIGFP